MPVFVQVLSGRLLIRAVMTNRSGAGELAHFPTRLPHAITAPSLGMMLDDHPARARNAIDA